MQNILIELIDNIYSKQKKTNRIIYTKRTINLPCYFKFR